MLLFLPLGLSKPQGYSLGTSFVTIFRECEYSNLKYFNSQLQNGEVGNGHTHVCFLLFSTQSPSLDVQFN